VSHGADDHSPVSHSHSDGDGDHSHSHNHNGGGGHSHPHRIVHSEPEVALAPSGEATVMLDIGPHAGALVLYTGEDLVGAEIEIRPDGGAWLGTHTAVRERHAGGRVLYAGVFGSLPEGPYDLRLKGGGPLSFDACVEVVAGAVTEATLPAREISGGGSPVPAGRAQ
jgi:hypothetical protein